VILSFCAGLLYWLSVNEAILMSCACRCRRLSADVEEWMPGWWAGQLVDIAWD